jgi:uncharacterized protein
MSKFHDLFPQKPVIGMLHLGGELPVFQTVEKDLPVYEAGGVDAVIVENYHGTEMEVQEVLMSIRRKDTPLKVGVNILGDFALSFELAYDWNADFIQIDSIQPHDINLREYSRYRERFPDLVVLGGVGFKYTSDPGGNLEAWLELGKENVDTIVTTGDGTGKETPLEKLIQYKNLLGDFPLIEGAGSTPQTVYQHLQVVDGVIVGSYFKPDGNTQLDIEPELVEEYMLEANKVRSS